MQIKIDSPVKLVIQPQHVPVMLQALAELPFKVSQPIIADIEKQLIESQPKETPPLRSVGSDS